MSNELATTQFEAMMAEAKTLVDSGFLPKAIRTPAQALAIMTMSKELGIGYWTGFNGINVISGKPTISPQLMLALIYKRHPEAVIQINGDAQSCTVFMQRKDGQSHTEVFTLEQASKIMTKEDDKVIPLTQKYNWRQQAAVMLKWRAVAACARVIFPDVIMGFYTPEEIEPDSQIEYETGELIQQHPAIDAEIVQEANETHQDAISEAQQDNGGRVHPEAVEDITLPFPPDRRFTEFVSTDWTAFWPFIAKYAAKKPSETHALVHTLTGVESMKDCPWTFGEFMTVLNQHMAA